MTFSIWTRLEYFISQKKTTLHASGSHYAGGKHAKDRIIVAFCASMTGEKLQPLVTGSLKILGVLIRLTNLKRSACDIHI